MPRGKPKIFQVAKLVMFTSVQLVEIQAYRECHDLVSDSEAIRRLIDRGLAKQKRKRVVTV